MDKRPGETTAFLSTGLADAFTVRTAWIIVAVSAVFFIAAVPFVAVPLLKVPAFTPIYVSLLVLCDLITAAILLSHFSALRSWSLLVLASGYLFTAFVTISYSLIFPGLFAETGLFGPGPQTTSVLYMFWHGGFPLFILVYSSLRARARRKGGGEYLGRPWVAVSVAIVLVAAVVVAFFLFATVGNRMIPEFLKIDRTTDLGHQVLAGVWGLSLLALIVLLLRRPHSVLDVWLCVVMTVWLFDLGLSAILNTGRYDLGWYAGRVYGLIASSFLLILLLMENSAHYVKLFQLTLELDAANRALEQLSSHDALTELYNRRALDTRLDIEVADAQRFHRPLSVVMIDVDHFKAFNDTYGHQAGDDCLKKVASTLQWSCRRPSDLAARFGGEEFVLILPDTGLEGAREIANTARRGVLQLAIAHGRSESGSLVSISAGVATFQSGTSEDLIARADAMLYLAKGRGRNRVEPSLETVTG